MTPLEELKAEYKKRFAGKPVQVTPAPFDQLIVASLHAMMDGTATPHQQKKLIEWIINKASRANGMHYTDHQADKDFAMGRAFVGQQMLELLRIPMINLPPDTTPPEPPETKNPKRSK
jgi:hypothetical protein